MSAPTVPFTAAQVHAKLAGQLGRTEAPAGSNHTPYGVAMGLDRQPWCAVFQGWAWHELGYSWRQYWANLGGGPFAWCRVAELLAIARTHGMLVSAASARFGDLALYSFHGGGTPEHIGFVTGRNMAGAFGSIEGNTGPDDAGSQANGGGVFARVRPDRFVVGVIRPPYLVATTPKPAAHRPAPITLRRVLRLTHPYMTGGDVAAIQRRLGAGVDGSYGPITVGVVTRFQQRYWPRNRAQWDGKVGPATAHALGMVWVTR